MDADETFFEEEESQAVKKSSSTAPWVLLVIVLGGAVGGGIIGYGKFQDVQRSVNSARKESEEARARLTELEGAKKSLESRVAALAEENGRLTAERDGLNQKLRDAPPPAAETKAEPVKMTKSKLKSWKKMAKKSRR